MTTNQNTTGAILEYVDPHTGNAKRVHVTVIDVDARGLHVQTKAGNSWWANMDRVVAYPVGAPTQEA